MSLDLDAEDGVFKWPLLNPIALLWYLCDRHSRFGSYLIEKLSGGIADKAIWADEATSGNKLRPDNRTKFIYNVLDNHKLRRALQKQRHWLVPNRHHAL